METTNKPIARWTIGASTINGYKSLLMSIESFLSFYDVEVIVYYNCDIQNLADISARFPTFDQRKIKSEVQPKGVAWKLYPSRVSIEKHEIQIDNDLIITEKISEIDEFLYSNRPLLLEGDSRTYGRFEKYVPAGLMINSGIFGMPPGFNLQKYIDFHVKYEWEQNAYGRHKENFTFDEQGIVAMALGGSNPIIIPESKISNCELNLNKTVGMHFVGLNRYPHHRPFLEYKNKNVPLYL